MRNAKLVMIGGGTGSFTLLSSLKKHVHDITAIVNMIDDGGSSGVLRDELGALPPGDIRQCLVALSRSTRLMRKLFNYRFAHGFLKGHAFGNLFLTALEKTTGSFGEAVKQAGEVLNIQGRVVPVTLSDSRLQLRQGRRVLRGQAVITQSWFRGTAKPQLSLRPPAKLNPEAAAALKAADMLVIAPGNLYTSIIPTLLVDGMTKAINSSKATLVYVCNLVTKPGQTTGFNVEDFAAELESYIGDGTLDYVIYNNRQPPPSLLKKYAKAGEHGVGFKPASLQRASYQAIGANLISDKLVHQDPADSVERTLIRHDGDKTAKLITKLIK